MLKYAVFLIAVFGGLESISAEPISLRAAPWQNGERLEMKIISPKDGRPLGNLIFYADSLDPNQKIWLIGSDRFFSRDNTREMTRVYARQNSLTPIFSITKNKDGDFNTVYQNGSLILTTKKAGASSESRISFSDTVYDNEEILHLVRRLPLQTGYRTSFKVFSATDNAIAKCKLDVSRQIETVEWAKGRMPCFVVNIRAYVFLIKVEEHRLWISTDERHLPLRHVAEDNILELTDFYIRTDDSQSSNAR